MSEKFCFLNKEAVEQFLNTMENNKRRKFFSNAHSLWVRFHNYESNAPMAIVKDNQLKSIAFVSKLKTKDMINLYDIVSFEKGYGKKLWIEMIADFYIMKNVHNIKFRALYSAIKFYDNLGIYFWGFDGKSFTVEQPLYPTIEEMQEWRNQFILNPVCGNEKLLEDKIPPKSNQCIIDNIKKDLGMKFYFNHYASMQG
jgi:hypothetical protein